MKNELRGAAVGSGLARVEQWNGKEHLVVPVVGMVNNAIVRPMNSRGPERVPLSGFEKTLSQWEGRPLFLGHPLKDGRPVLAITSMGQAFGVVRNPKITDGRLSFEAWMDAEKAPDHLQERARAGDEIQISIGALVRTIEAADGLTEWADVTPDHLAMLPGDIAGACNYEMGCGVRAASAEATFCWPDSKTGEDDHGRVYVVGEHKTSDISAKGTIVSSHTSYEKAKADAQRRANETGNRHSVKSADDAQGRGSLKISDHYPEGRHASEDDAIFELELIAAWQDKSGNDDHGRANAQAAQNATRTARTASKLAEKTGKSGNHAAAQQAHHDAAAANGKAGNSYMQQYHTSMASQHGFKSDHARFAEGDHMYERWLQEGPETDALLKTLRNIPQSVRDKMPKEDFAGPNESYPIELQVDVEDVARSLGRAKGDPSVIKAKAIAIAQRKGFTLPDSWKEAKAASMLTKILSVLGISAEQLELKAAECGCQNKESKMKTKAERVKALIAVKDSGYTDADQAWLEAVPDARFEALEAMAAGGIKAAASKADADKAIGDYAAAHDALKAHAGNMKDKAAKDEAKKADETKAACIASIKATGKNDRTDAALAAMSQGQLDELLKTMSAPVAPTFEELLAKATPEVRAAIEAGANAAKAKKVDAIKTLRESKRCDLTDKELEAKSQSELDALVKLADLKSDDVDFSGGGMPRGTQSSQQGVAAPRDLVAEVRAAAAKK